MREGLDLRQILKDRVLALGKKARVGLMLNNGAFQ